MLEGCFCKDHGANLFGVLSLIGFDMHFFSLLSIFVVMFYKEEQLKVVNLLNIICYLHRYLVRVYVVK